jgi:phosphatidate cytidylyltransferase
MLRHRLLTSTILVAIVATCVWLDATRPLLASHGLWLFPLLMFFTFGTAWEMAKLIALAGVPIHRGIAVSGAVGIVLGACVPMLWTIRGDVYPVDCPIGRVGWVGVMAVVAVGVALVNELRVFERTPQSPHGQVATRLASSVFVSVYVGAPLAFLVLIRTEYSGTRGLMDLVGVVAVTKCGDIGAYIAGKLLGKHKLIPRVSPGKTWEGLLGGIALSVAASYLWFASGLVSAIPAAPHLWAPALLGVFLSILGLIGDLAESMIKRDTGQKDSGGMLPGLGGVWDVTDSLIGTSLVAYFMIVSRWLG